MLLQLNKSYPLQMIHASKYPCIFTLSCMVLFMNGLALFMDYKLFFPKFQKISWYIIGGELVFVHDWYNNSHKSYVVDFDPGDVIIC